MLSVRTCVSNCVRNFPRVTARSAPHKVLGNAVASPFDPQSFSMGQRLGNFFMGCLDDSGTCRSGYSQLYGGILLIHTYVIYQPDSLILLNVQNYLL